MLWTGICLVVIFLGLFIVMEFARGMASNPGGHDMQVWPLIPAALGAALIITHIVVN